jgi:hypothetical protein
VEVGGRDSGTNGSKAKGLARDSGRMPGVGGVGGGRVGVGSAKGLLSDDAGGDAWDEATKKSNGSTLAAVAAGTASANASKANGFGRAAPGAFGLVPPYGGVVSGCIANVYVPTAANSGPCLLLARIGRMPRRASDRIRQRLCWIRHIRYHGNMFLGQAFAMHAPCLRDDAGACGLTMHANIAVCDRDDQCRFALARQPGN